LREVQLIARPRQAADIGDGGDQPEVPYFQIHHHELTSS
jgi:hypothetical protein